MFLLGITEGWYRADSIYNIQNENSYYVGLDASGVDEVL